MRQASERHRPCSDWRRRGWMWRRPGSVSTLDRSHLRRRWTLPPSVLGPLVAGDTTRILERLTALVAGGASGRLVDGLLCNLLRRLLRGLGSDLARGQRLGLQAVPPREPSRHLLTLAEHTLHHPAVCQSLTGLGALGHHHQL